MGSGLWAFGSRLGALFALTLSPATAGAQSDTLAVLEGHVRDAVDSGAVAYAEIRVGSTSQYTRSDGHGRYRITDIVPGEREIVVRLLGYAPTTYTQSFAPGAKVTRDHYLNRVPRLLSTMEVRGKNLRVPAGFETIYKRADRGLGSFVTREQIDSLNPRDIMGVLRTVPFIRVENTGSEFGYLVSQRCREIQLLLNGTPIRAPDAVARILYSTPPSWIQAIEVYDSHARMPVEFVPNCGVIAVWTRGR